MQFYTIPFISTKKLNMEKTLKNVVIFFHLFTLISGSGFYVKTVYNNVWFSTEILFFAMFTTFQAYIYSALI